MAADLMRLDYRQMTADVLEGAASELDVILTRGRKDHLRTLVVAGRTVVEDGIVRSVDLAALESELLGQARTAWPAAPEAAKLRHRYHAALADFYGCRSHQRRETDGS
jgi:hypothetical protein